ncbi:MAG: transcription-repair coupling factor [Balneolaceae bacterium]
MIKQIRKRFKDEFTPPLREQLLQLDGNVYINGVTGSALSFLIADLTEKAPKLIFIAPDPEKAEAVAADLEKSDIHLPILLYPPSGSQPWQDPGVTDHSARIQRSEVLTSLKEDLNSVVITSPVALSEKVLPPDEHSDTSLLLRPGETHDPKELKSSLIDQGYSAVSFVDEPGEFAVRGGIFDIFPWTGEYPVRLDYFGDEIESIREFDPDTQRSVSFLDEAMIAPNRSAGSRTPGDSFFRYLSDSAVRILLQPDLILSETDRFYSRAVEIRQSLEDSELPETEECYLNSDALEREFHGKGLTFHIGGFGTGIKSTDHHFTISTSPHPEFGGSFKLLRKWITERTVEGYQILILCDNQNQKDRFEELLGEGTEDYQYTLALAPLHEGFLLPNQKVAILTDHQIFGRYYRPGIRRRRKVTGGISFKELKDLNMGDFVTHIDHGIGVFAGFKKIRVRDTLQESAVLRYQGDSILYVNVSSLHKLQKYSGREGRTPRVTKLGSGEWAKKKSATRKKVKEIARELIRLYARRKMESATAYEKDQAWQTEMEARFEFEETPDQLAAIQAVKRDMESEHPMDRLICGDVGFGKTEVAVRAAFKAVLNRKQVAILVPTTILADQHYQTFSRRMKEFPVNVESLSRFRSPAEQKRVAAGIADGTVDIVAGTHRLISKDIRFKDLGLLVIDEEQRFGVSVKEKLKEYRASVDVLTLTATPIPRTLQFSLMGARDLSIINTPPANRQPVQTEIIQFSEALIRDAVLRETGRGGQIFFIHNRVKNIEETADMLRALLPNVRVRHAHGQMAPSQLEKIIHDFYNHSFDLLVSTNIVENGIDISNANTIIINQANRFGLSELHQLRGRVGRSNRKAYCYLVAPPVQSLTPEARKRLLALEEHNDLGSGFNIAMRDLDIRGAGDILGAEQSGFVNDVGFELYSKIVDEAVREIREEELGSDAPKSGKGLRIPDTHVEFDHSALLPDSYVQDSVERLNLYRKLSSAATPQEVDEWKEELEDRFGPLPDEAVNLWTATRIKWYGSRLLLKKVTIRSGRMWLVCPGEKGDTAPHFYESGHFQTLLESIGELGEFDCSVVQKQDAVRLVLQNIEGPSGAASLLEMLYRQISDSREKVGT